jgi:hypothetical protein
VAAEASTDDDVGVLWVPVQDKVLGVRKKAGRREEKGRKRGAPTSVGVMVYRHDSVSVGALPSTPGKCSRMYSPTVTRIGRNQLPAKATQRGLARPLRVLTVVSSPVWQRIFTDPGFLI